MTNEPNAPDPIDDRSDTRRVRLFVDDEMPADERAAFARRLDDEESLRLQVDFEQTLRRHVARAMEASAPASLAGDVRAALRREAEPARDPVVGRVDADGATSRGWRWLRDPRHANVAAVVATLALVAGAVLWGIFGRPIDHVTPRPEVGAAEAARYVDGEHTRCVLDEDVLRTRVAFEDRRELLGACLEELGIRPTLPDLRPAGYELVGGGPCAVPGDVGSYHVIYRRSVPDRPTATVSLFAVPDVGQFDELTPRGLVPGNWYQVSTEPAVDHRVDCATDGRLVYFLVCCDARDVPAVAGLMSAGMDDGSGRR